MVRSSPNGWSRLTVEAQTEIMDGALAIRRIRRRKDYSHWVRVGRALLRLQEEAMHLSGSNSPHGRGYTALRVELGSRVPDLDEIHKTTRAHAVWLVKNLVAVEKWRAVIGETQRQELNHPSSIKRRLDARNRAKEAGESNGQQKQPSPAAKKDAEIVRLQEENDAKDAEIRRLKRRSDNVSEGRDWTWSDDPEAIARAWLQLQPTKAVRIASKVLELSKSTGGSDGKRRSRDR